MKATTATKKATPVPAITTTSNDGGRHELLVLTSIDVSKSNPRTHFDQAKLDELAESIIRLGVLQPILVRPKGKDRFELVAGERRFRASKQAGVATIPAIVRELDDKTTLEIQVVENLQREDLHPLEEAEGYAQLIKSHGYDADSLALKIGKSRSYVYGRMKLSDLCTQAKKALWNGEISHSVALLIARIPDEKLQAKAAKEIIETYAESMTYREAFNFIQDNYMLSLSGAPWKKADAELVPAAGPCTTCLFRTGNQKELFGDVKSADVCTKPTCFKSKQDAHWKRLQATAKENGHRILPANEEKGVFRYGRISSYDGPYVQLDDKIDWNSKKTYRTALGNKLPQVTVAREPESGKILELLPRKVAIELLVATGALQKNSHTASNDRYKDDQKREAEKRKLERSIENTIIAEVQPKMAALTFSTELLRIITKALGFAKASYGMEAIFKRRGLKYADWNGREKLISTFVDGLTDGEMAPVCAELTMTFGNMEARSGGEKDLMRQLARLVEVDVDGIDKRIRAEAAAKKKAKAAKKGKKTKAAKKPAARKTVAPDPSGRCIECGCTDAKACEGGCTWVDAEHTVCSSCEIDAIDRDEPEPSDDEGGALDGNGDLEEAAL